MARMRRALVVVTSAVAVMSLTAGAAQGRGLSDLEAMRASTGSAQLTESAELGTALASALPTLRYDMPSLRTLRAPADPGDPAAVGVVPASTVMEAFGVDEPAAPGSDEAVMRELDDAGTEAATDEGEGGDVSDWEPAPMRSLRVAYLDPEQPLERAMRARPALASVLLDPHARAIATHRSADGLLVAVVERDAFAQHAPVVWPRVIDLANYGGITVTGLGFSSSERVELAADVDELQDVTTGAVVMRPRFRVGANVVKVAGTAHSIMVPKAPKSADWRFTSKVTPAQRRTFRAIMRASREPGARRIANELRPMVVVTIGDRKTDCTSEGFSCAGGDGTNYVITMHPGHLTTWGDGPLIVWHEFAHIAYFASLETERLDKATVRALKGRCIRSWQGPRDPSQPLPCTPPTEAFADNFAFWALHRDRADAGYLRKRVVAHPVMRRLAASMRTHLA